MTLPHPLAASRHVCKCSSRNFGTLCRRASRWRLQSSSQAVTWSGSGGKGSRRRDKQSSTCPKEITRVLHPARVVPPYPAIHLNPAYPQPYHRTKLYTPIPKLVTVFLRPEHQLGHLPVPMVKHQLKFRGRHICAVLLEEFQFLEGPMTNEELLEDRIVIFAVRATLQWRARPNG